MAKRLSKEEMAEDVTEQFMNSQRVAEAISNALNSPGLDATPLEMAFAGILMDKIFQKRIPNWVLIRNWAIKNWEMLEEAGAIPDASIDVEEVDVQSPER